MSSKIFKLSSITLALAASFGAQAAIYNVYDYQPVVDNNAKTYGVAIEPETGAGNCWSGTSCVQSTYKIAYEEKLYNEGFNYRDEAPFLIENGYEYLDDDFSGFENYCNSFLGYNNTLCNEWATEHYTNGYAKESSSFNNSYAYLESASSPVQALKNNVVVNRIIDSAGNTVGTYYNGSLKNRTKAFPDLNLELQGGIQSKVFNKIGNISVGSVSFASSGYPDTDFTSKAAIWENDDLHLVSDAGAEDGRSMPQGSVRDIILATSNSNYYAVGYASNAEEVSVASIFELKSGTGSDLDSTPKYVTQFNDQDIYLNSILTSVNKNGIAIGTAKYRNSIDGAFANRIFYVADVTQPQSSLAVVEFNSKFSSMFFASANAKAGSINSYDEAVGAVDNQTHQESGGGKPRSQRAFIAPLSDKAKAPLDGKAWYLDDLTNDGSASSLNNQYRIIDATDINDAGVISGTANYCAGGYDTTNIDSKCNGGAPNSEKIVAVKLVPIESAKSSDIQVRASTTSTVDRQGGSLGFLALTLLGFLGFRRK